MIDINYHDPAPTDHQNQYEQLNGKLLQSSFGGSAAQAHGIASGLVCRDVKSSELESAAARLLFDDAQSMAALESLHEMSIRDLNQAEFNFDLLLPEDESSSAQLEALSEWSQGFIIGLMFDRKNIASELSGELKDSIDDIIQIAALEGGETDSPEDEATFVELREYLRTVTQLIYEELNPNRPIESVHK